MNPDPIQNESAETAPAQAPTTAGMTTKVVKGSLWTLAGQVAPLGVSLFTTPFVIRLLGSEGYGVLILVGLIPTYFAFADLGMGIASTKFASEAYAAGDAKREASTVHTAAAMSFILSVPVAALIFIFSNTAVGLFNVPEHLRGEANLALKIACVTFVLNFLNSIFNTPQLTRLRMDLNTFVSSGFRMLGLIATPITIYLGGGIVGAVAVLLAVSILTLAANFAVSGKLLRELFTFTINRNAIRPMLKFGGALMVSGIAGIFLVNAEKGMISAILEPRSLAYYYVAFTFVNMMTLFSSAMVQSLLPAFSQLQENRNHSVLESLFVRGIRINLVWLLPALLVLSLIAKPFFTIWAGEDFGRESVWPFYILLSGIIVNVLAYFPHVMILSAGKSDSLAKLYLVELAPYLLILWLFTSYGGIMGTSSAWSIRVIADAVILFILAQQISAVSFPVSEFLKFAPLLIIIMIPFGLNLYFQKLSPGIIATAIASMIIYAILTWKLILEESETRWISGVLGGYLRRIRA